jgi:hypothetical protein
MEITLLELHTYTQTSSPLNNGDAFLLTEIISLSLSPRQRGDVTSRFQGSCHSFRLQFCYKKPAHMNIRMCLLTFQPTLKPMIKILVRPHESGNKPSIF